MGLQSLSKRKEGANSWHCKLLLVHSFRIIWYLSLKVLHHHLIIMIIFFIIYSFLKGKLPKSFDNFFLRCSDIHSNPTRFSRSECLYMPRFKSVKYGLNSISNICVNSWNKLTEIFESPSSLSLSELKSKMFNHYISNY